MITPRRIETALHNLNPSANWIGFDFNINNDRIMYTAVVMMSAWYSPNASFIVYCHDSCWCSNCQPLKVPWSPKTWGDFVADSKVIISTHRLFDYLRENINSIRDVEALIHEIKQHQFPNRHLSLV